MTSGKYQNLIRAQEAEVAVPALLHLSSEQLASGSYGDEVLTFCRTNQHGSYIVRSAVTAEDDTTTSYAGYFKSSGAVSKEQLHQTIHNLFEENKKRAADADVNTKVSLMIMPFIESEYGGVLFYPWLYFYKHALVEFATSPQAAVSGQDTTAGLLSIDPALPNSDTLASLPNTLTSQLRFVLEKMRTIFSFEMDIEWAFDGTTLYILQVRPVTISPSAIESRTLQSSSPYVFNNVSEAFGKLSPISFALFEFLFSHAEKYWQRFAIQGGNAFLYRMPTGNILVEPKAYEQYYKSTVWYGALVRGLRTTKIASELQSDLESFSIPETFVLDTTQLAFDNWQSAILLERIRGKQPSTIAQPFEYELSKQINLGTYPNNTLAARWKRLFLATTLPLRTMLNQEPGGAWSTNIEILEFDKETNNYTQELTESLCTYIPTNKDATGHIFGPQIDGPVFHIDEPERWSAQLPSKVILLVPYIPQTWIAELPHILGIATCSLTTLSHVAIVLREHNIPTARIDTTMFNTIENGTVITV